MVEWYNRGVNGLLYIRIIHGIVNGLVVGLVHRGLVGGWVVGGSSM